LAYVNGIFYFAKIKFKGYEDDITF